MPDHTVLVEEIQILAEQADSSVLTEEVEVVEVVAEGLQGPPGPPGPGGVTTHTLTAGAILGGLRVVLNGPSGAVHASADNADHSARVIGITLGAATTGNPVTVQATGRITELSWTWTPDDDIYLGLNGVLTQTIPPTAAFAQRVGYAVTPTSMWVDITEPVVF